VVRADGALGKGCELLRTPRRRSSGRSAEAKLTAMPKSASSRSDGLIVKEYVLPGGCGARSAGRIFRPVLRQREGRGSTTDGSKLPAPPRRGEGRTHRPSSSPRRLPLSAPSYRHLRPLHEAAHLPGGHFSGDELPRERRVGELRGPGGSPPHDGSTETTSPPAWRSRRFRVRVPAPRSREPYLADSLRS
jgi:hypothetical protein